MTDDTHDPRGLIAQSFQIPDITLQDCRTIFLDWAVSLPHDDMAPSAAVLAERHGADHPDHPMITVLNEAQIPIHRKRRRRK
ncbi:hypothetical protein [Actibacterium pelagium]|uniref:Uncharacterized protein n=1 Tax=Actibacterium pelagium TaxID=2029103 RepID=A0A917EIU0_9RHOB|nr:hypothetical protein [Actibacterium pelagium]GGE41697.1 hypothetical protein GCM10011517_06640 [Actibacterium pelagium]